MIAMSFRSRHISCVKIYPGIENKRENSNEYYEERLDVTVVELLPGKRDVFCTSLMSKQRHSNIITKMIET